MHLLLGVEVSQCCDAVMLVVGIAQLERQLGRGAAGIFGQQGLQVGLSCLLLLLQSLQNPGSFLSGTNIDT